MRDTIREELAESQAAQARTESLAAQCVFELFEQTHDGRFHLEEIETELLDALEALLGSELQDRIRRAQLDDEGVQEGAQLAG